jgi:hypothetical protein
MLRRVDLQDTEDALQKQTWYLQPHRYSELFLAGVFEPEPLTMAGRDVEEVVDDVDEMDAYFASLEQKRGMTGADLFSALDEPDEEGWQ